MYAYSQQFPNKHGWTEPPSLKPFVTFVEPTWMEPAKTVGVVGIGGLCSFFTHKMGAKVVAALSRGTNKEEFAKQLGADYLLDTTNNEAMAAAAGTIDLLIFTTAGGNIEVNKYLPLMKPYGSIHFLWSCGVAT
jgi:D-arabinose 1-dehydrogenase-like Zn-dependent alcohol dehydrogenase